MHKNNITSVLLLLLLLFFNYNKGKTENHIHAILAIYSTVTKEDDTSVNNNFRFIEDDFIPTQTKRNGTTRHQGIWNTEWTVIEELKGIVVNYKNAKDGVCDWIVAESVDEDVFEIICK